MKRALAIVGIIVVVVLAGFLGRYFWAKSKSPEATVMLNQNGFSVTVDYCRPYKRGRVIFGGLIPYGKVWRTGANEATSIAFNQPVTINGQTLAAGQYSLWTIPQKEQWTVIFNRETGQSGTKYNAAEDVLRVSVDSRKHTPAVDQFTISFVPQSNGADMLLTWDETEAVVPVRK